MRDELIDGIAGGAMAAVLSGVPSTAHAIATRTSPVEATLAAGSIALPQERRPVPLALAAVPVHLALSLGWGALLGAALPRERTVAAGVAAGVAIAALDLGLIGRRYPRVRALPTAPQVADHLAYGLVVAGVVRQRRARRESPPSDSNR